MSFDLTKVQPFQAPQEAQTTPQQGSGQQFNLDTVKPFQEPGQQPEQPKISGPMAFVANFNDAVNKLASGIFRPLLGEKIINDTRNLYRSQAAMAAEQHPILSTLGNITGNIATAVPAIVAAPATGVLGATAIGAGYGAATLPEGGQSRLFNGLTGAATGLVGGAVGKTISGIGKILPSAKVAQAGAAGVEDTSLKSAADRLGIRVAPVETNSSIGLKNLVTKKLETNPEEVAQISATLAKREDQIKQTLDDVVGSVLKDPRQEGTLYNQTSLQDSKTTTDSIYEKLKPQIIDQKYLGDIIPPTKGLGENIILVSGAGKAKNKIVDEKLNYVQRLYKEAHEPGSGMNWDNVQPGSFEDLLNTNKYIDTKKRIADAAVSSAGKQGITSGSKSASSIHLDQAKDTIENAMSTVDTTGEYPIAKQMVAQQSFVNDIARQVEDARLSKPGQKIPNSEDIYNTLFSTTAKRKEFISKIESLGGDAEKANDLIEVLSGIHKSPVNKLLGSRAGTGARSTMGAAGNNIASASIGGIPLMAAVAGARKVVGGAEQSALKSSIFGELPTNTAPGAGAQPVLNATGVIGGNEINN